MLDKMIHFRLKNATTLVLQLHTFYKVQTKKSCDQIRKPNAIPWNYGLVVVFISQKPILTVHVNLQFMIVQSIIEIT